MTISHDTAGHAVDLANCDREPIHIPGRVQPHGILLALSEPDLVIEQASANAAGHFGAAAEHLVGSRLLDHVHPDGRGPLRDALSAPDLRDRNPLQLPLPGVTFDGVAHRHDGVLVLELENPRPPGTAARAADHSRALQRAMTRLQDAGTFREFCQVAAAEARAIGGFDRATIYRFDAAWNGEVVGEDKRADLTPLDGLHFPASDIPEQARRLYHLNPYRLIADVGYEPVPLVPEVNPRTGRPLDLSFAVSRSVSPVHVQYLKNMDATASMSVSLMRGGRLWGLISCMHYSGAKYLPFADRAACQFLGTLVSVQIAVKEDSEGVEYRHRLQAVRERLLQRMAEEPDLARALTGDPADLLGLAAAEGAAVVSDGGCAAAGRAPATERIQELVAWLRVHADGDVFHTDSLSRLAPEFADLKDVASGVLAVTTSRAAGHWVLWFRPEVVQTVGWGGDPYKPVGEPGPTGRLSPRRSFELWKEEVHNKSLPWQPAEVEAARLLRDAVVAVVVRRAEELTRLNTELRRSNTDLDAFAYSASHDLKEPLRGLSNYATFLLEDYAGRLDVGGVDKLNTLVRLTRRMDDLIESLLRFSRLGRDGGTFEPVALDEVLRGVLDALKGRLAEGRVAVRVPRPLPTVRCDRVQVGEVFSNLIVNAAKYTDKAERWVEVGYDEPIGRPGGSAAPVFYVRDNGIGIDEEHRHLIFRLFKRLHARDEFGGGTGVGLAIVKKIVEHHGGTVWVDSRPGHGSTFHFTLGG
ncbi:ATP-binding protein [Gemmata sp. JC717]|uniref:ATP-binding protein n=1 Tax=Gemmata algarum TaxID=2975278 RepID=UPI0021BB7F3A|nr:ATP-binding protein [Gemmata algarum]MDY3555643.1 ATP-binding protein [Gemmata algarum]